MLNHLTYVWILFYKECNFFLCWQPLAISNFLFVIFFSFYHISTRNILQLCLKILKDFNLLIYFHELTTLMSKVYQISWCLWKYMEAFFSFFTIHHYNYPIIIWSHFFINQFFDYLVDYQFQYHFFVLYFLLHFFLLCFCITQVNHLLTFS